MQRGKKKYSGYLTMAIGPVFSGKSEWTQFKARKIAKSQARHEPVLAVKFKVDTRYQSHEGEEAIKTHNGNVLKKSSEEITSVRVMDIQEFLKSSFDGFDIIIVEEIHLGIKDGAKNYESEDILVKLVYEKIKGMVLRQDKIVFIPCNDFWGNLQQVKIIHELFKIAYTVKYVRSKCDCCAADSSGTISIQRSDMRSCVDGSKSPQIKVGGADIWMAICPHCHEYCKGHGECQLNIC